MFVWSIRVVSKNFIVDFGMTLKSIIGGRLKGYEAMVNKGIEECQKELENKYGHNIANLRIETSDLKDSIQIIVCGEAIID